MRILILACLSLALSFVANPVAAQEPAPQRGLTVIGIGEVKARPDLAIIRLGVVSQAATARAALDANNEAMAALLAVLERQGIADRDVQTTQFVVQPRYHHDPDGREPPRIDGYEVSNQVAVTVRDLDRLGSVLDEAVSVGSNNILGIELGLDDPEPQRDEARRLAIADARRKAEVYAEAAGVALGAMRSISEEVRPGPPQPAYRMEMAQSSVPIAEGEQAITIEVTVKWEIGPR